MMRASPATSSQAPRERIRRAQARGRLRTIQRLRRDRFLDTVCMGSFAVASIHILGAWIGWWGWGPIWWLPILLGVGLQLALRRQRDVRGEAAHQRALTRTFE